VSNESRLAKWWSDHPQAEKCYQVLMEFFETRAAAGNYMRAMHARHIRKHVNEEILRSAALAQNDNEKRIQNSDTQ
jgi:hypothetical protein